MDSVLQLYGLAMVILPVYGFVSLRKRIRFGRLAKSAALLRYAALVIAPIVLYAAIFILCIAVEEMTSWSPVSEEVARSFPLAIALGLLVWILGIVMFAFGLLSVRAERATSVD